MDAKKPSVGDLILQTDKTFVIPPYQRSYQWKPARWQPLVQDIINKVSSAEKQHWIGIIITSLSEDQTPQRSYRHKYFDLIDGQQRIVTLRIWLQAVIDHANDNDIELIENGNLSFAEIICQESNKEELKLVLTRDAWRRRWRTYPNEESGLVHCYTYFRWVLWLGQAALLSPEPDPLPKKPRSEAESALPIEEQWTRALVKRAHSISSNGNSSDQLFQIERSAVVDCDALIRATINCLSIVELERQELLDEDPAEIFEALNGQRTPLEQFDHVRNYIFTGIRDPQKRKLLYDETWKHYEVALDQANLSARGSSPAETFLYDYLISIGETKYQKSFSKTRTASHFARFFEARTDLDHEKVARESLLPNLSAWIAVNRKGERFQVKNEAIELDSESKRRLHMLDSLSSGPVVPILERLVVRRLTGEYSEESLRRQLFWVETFLGRKILKRLALSPLRSEMMNFAGKLPANFSEEELRDALILITPTDEEIRGALLPKTINRVLRYEESSQIAHSGGLKPRQILAIFQAIETHKAGPLRNNLLESTSDEAFSIEHIFPQDAANWRTELRLWGVGQSFMENRLHTLGNLGIIPKRLNSQLSNLSFHNKKETTKSPLSRFPKLKINESWTKDDQTKWTPDIIDARAEELISSALNYWRF